MIETRKRPPKESPLTISERRYFVGFEHCVRTRLAPVVRNGREVAPNPACVRRILKDERPSRKMLINIFRNAPGLLEHPLTHPAVKKIFDQWRKFGTIPDGYGRGMPQKTARDCVKEG